MGGGFSARGVLAQADPRERPKKLAFFTGRDQSQQLTSWFAQQFGTPNFAAHGGFCSVNMAAAGIMTIGGAFWEFGSPDWDRTKMFMLFGVAEDHDSNPIKLGLSKLKARGAKVVGVNPVRTGYNAIADEWVGITPGTDGLFVLALVHELLKAGQVDVDYLIRYTNAAWLVIDDPGAPDHGLFARDGDGGALIWDRAAGKLIPHHRAGVKPALKGEFRLDDGRPAVPAFQLLAQKYLDERYAPENVAGETGVPAATMRRLAAELTHTAFREEIVVEQPWTDMKGERHERMIGRPVTFHAMRGISAHSNGFQTCRALHLLQVLLGAIDCPGGFRLEPPYPKPLDAHPRPAGNAKPGQPLCGPPLGFPRGPEDLLLEADGLTPQRIDKAYSWEAPIAAHGMMHMSNAFAGDPYPVDVLFMYMANMSWNSSMNSRGVMEMLEAKRDDGSYVIPKIIYSDAYSSEMVAYADLVLPDTTYLERHDCISLRDRPISEPEAVADSIRWPVLPPDRDVRGFQSVLIELGARLGLPGFVDEAGAPKYRDYADFMVRHEWLPGVGPLAGFRGVDGHKIGRGEPNPDQIERYIANGGFWLEHVPPEARYFKHANADYQRWAVSMGFFECPQPVTFQLYLSLCAASSSRRRGTVSVSRPSICANGSRAASTRCDLVPALRRRTPGRVGIDRRVPAACDHAAARWPPTIRGGSQNAWLRQIHGWNPLYVPTAVCDEHGLEDGDWAWLISHHGRIKARIGRNGRG
jgi:anaerobic selenocysteine-containing dehydrogenase